MIDIEKIKEAIAQTEAKITDAKKVIPFPMYLVGVKEGLEWSLRLLTSEVSNDKQGV